MTTLVVQIGRTRRAIEKAEAEKAKLREMLEPLMLEASAQEIVDAPSVIIQPPAVTMSVEQVAAQLGVHALTVRRAIARGEIPAVKVGRRVLVPVKAWKDSMQAVTGA